MSIVDAVVSHRMWDTTGIASKGIRKYLLAGFAASLMLELVDTFADIPEEANGWWFMVAYIVVGVALYIVRRPVNATWSIGTVCGFGLIAFGVVSVAAGPHPEPFEPLNLLGIGLIVIGGIVTRRSSRRKTNGR